MRITLVASVLLLLLCLGTTPGARADPPPLPAANTVFVELVGSAPMISVNYERSLTEALALRAGVGYLHATSFLGNVLDWIQAPLLASYLIGEGAHRLELGAGAVPTMWLEARSEQRFGIYGAAILGYRYRAPGGGFTLRAGFTPIFDFWDARARGFPVVPLVGVSLGYGF